MGQNHIKSQISQCTLRDWKNFHPNLSTFDTFPIESIRITEI